MGARGPLPDLKVIDGKIQPPKRTPQPKPKLPKCPSWLKDAGKREWRRVAKPLHRLGLLTELDTTALATYCQCIATYTECQVVMNEKGETYETPTGQLKLRPEYYISRDMLKEIRALCALFGLAPGPRMRLQLPEPTDTELDELEDILD